MSGLTAEERMANVEYAMVKTQHKLLLKYLPDSVLKTYCQDFINYTFIKEQLADLMMEEQYR
jgi:hypothetical protein